jgi:hypothetical protein
VDAWQQAARWRAQASALLAAALTLSLLAGVYVLLVGYAQPHARLLDAAPGGRQFYGGLTRNVLALSDALAAHWPWLLPLAGLGLFTGLRSLLAGPQRWLGLLLPAAILLAALVLTLAALMPIRAPAL